jgi:hypothetical protein
VGRSDERLTRLQKVAGSILTRNAACQLAAAAAQDVPPIGVGVAVTS